MDHVNSTIAVQSNVSAAGGPKIKGGNGIAASPSHAAFSNCTSSPLSAMSNNERSASPFSSYTPDSGCDEISSKNGSNSFVASSPIALSTPPSVTSSTASSNKPGIKLKVNISSSEKSSNTYMNTASPNEVKGNMVSLRDKPMPANHIASDNARSAHSRNYLSARTSRSSGGNCTRRYNSGELASSKEAGYLASKRGVLNHTKSSEVINTRTDSDVGHESSCGRQVSGYDSPCDSFHSPASSESALVTSIGRNKVALSHSQTQDIAPPTTSISAGSLGHTDSHISRTSSNNSVSDLSRCSEVTDETNGDTTIASSVESVLPRGSYSPGKSARSNNEANMSYSPYVDEALANVLGTLQESDNTGKRDGLPGLEDIKATDVLSQDDFSADKISLSLGDAPFGYPAGASGPDDIPPDALNLSAEDVRQTLSSVSGEADLPELNTDSVFDSNPTAMLSHDMNYDGTSNINSSSVDGLPQPASAVSMATSTSSSTAIATSTASSTTHVSTVMLSSTVSLNNCPTSSTTTTGPSVPGRSHLQEILGEKDTDRLKKMSCPIDVYQPGTPTSFASNKSNQAGLTMPNSSTGSTMNPSQFNRFPSANVPYQRHAVPSLPPTSASPYTVPGHGPMLFDSPSTVHHSNFSEYGMAARPGMPFDPSMSHLQGPNMSYSQPSSQCVPVSQAWPRASYGGANVPSPNFKSGDGSKSPRGSLAGPKFPNPMTALQSTVSSIPVNHIPVRSKSNGGLVSPANAYHNAPGTSAGPNDSSCVLSPATSGSMLPPPSPSLQPDKRSVSADGSLGLSTSTKKTTKRERGQSVDSKEGDKKDGAPKTKRRKSKSKDESKKATSECKSRSNSVNEANPYVYVFNSEVANVAADWVRQGKISSIIKYHQSSQKNCRLEASRSLSDNFGKQVTTTYAPSSQIPSNESPTQAKDKVTGQQILASPGADSHAAPTRPVKVEPSEPSPKQQRQDAAKPAEGILKSEIDSGNTGIAMKALSPSIKAKPENSDEGLSEQQRKHREESLTKLNKIKDILIGPPSRGNYEMTHHLQKVMAKENSVSGSDQETHEAWLRLVQAYNEKKRSISSTVPDGITLPADPPPPYTPSHAAGPSQRWPNPHAGQDILNPRVPGPGRSGQMRHAYDVRIAGSYMHPSRLPSRGPMYSSPGPPSGVIVGNMGRQQMPRLPQTHMNHPESFPFSETLKKKASLYQSDPIHTRPGSNMGFEMSAGSDAGLNIRMNSPDWPTFANQGPVANHAGGRLSHVGEAMSPPASHMAVGQSMMMPPGAAMPGQSLDPGMVPTAESRLTPNAALDQRMSSANMCGPPYPYSSKVTNAMVPYQDSSMSTLHTSYPSHDIKPPGNPMPGGMNVHSDRPNLMNESMAKRGDPRPPDLKLNPVHGGRHPLAPPSIGPSPGMIGQSPFMHGEMGPMPQVSPHPSAVPRSPMLNSPSLVKPAIGGANAPQYQSMGPSGIPQMSMEHPNLMQQGHSMPERGPPSEWVSVPQASIAVSRTPSSAGIIPSSHCPRSQSAINDMINRMNSYPIQSNAPIYPESGKASPPPLSHVNGAAMLGQDPPPLSHNPNSVESATMSMMGTSAGPMVRTPSGGLMPQQVPVGGAPPGYDPVLSGSRPVGPRSAGPPVVDGYMNDFNRPPSHPTMCMSPSTMHSQQQGNFVPTAPADVHGVSAGYIPQHGSMPHSAPVPAGPPSEASLAIPKFDLHGMIPKEKPSQTLSYFPSADPSGQESGHVDPGPSMPGRSPSTMQHPRFPCTSMGQRPFTPTANPFPVNSSSVMRASAPVSYGGSNPPGYHGPDPYPSPTWDTMSSVHRPLMMPGNPTGMHPSGYAPGGRSLM